MSNVELFFYFLGTLLTFELLISSYAYSNIFAMLHTLFVLAKFKQYGFEDPTSRYESAAGLKLSTVIPA